MVSFTLQRQPRLRALHKHLGCRRMIESRTGMVSSQLIQKSGKLSRQTQLHLGKPLSRNRQQQTAGISTDDRLKESPVVWVTARAQESRIREENPFSMISYQDCRTPDRASPGTESGQQELIGTQQEEHSPNNRNCTKGDDGAS